MPHSPVTLAALGPRGRPGLQGSGDTTLVRHHARMHTYGVYRLVTPILRRIAVRERTATIDALKASFEVG